MVHDWFLRWGDAGMRLSDDELFELPEDLGEAFVAGERIMRERLNQKLSELPDDRSSDQFTQEYMNNTIALANHCNISGIAGWKRAQPGNHDRLQYRRFVAEVDVCTMEIRLANVCRKKEYSVKLDAAAKQKLSHLLTQMRETVEKLNITVAKKDKLYKRINALQDEIDREHTGYHAFGALVIEVADNTGEAAKRLKPLTQMVERLAAAIGLAKRQESQLPPPTERKRITGPNANPEGKCDVNSALDDEIHL